MDEAPARILVVDDEAQVCRVAQRVLRRAGFVVEIAASATAAIKQRGPWDLLLIDIQLPNGSVEDISHAFPGVPVLTMSGLPGAQIDKPFKNKELVAAVQAVLRSRWEALMARVSLSQTLKNLPAIQARTVIPAHRRKSQWLRTVAGGVIFAAALFAPMPTDVPWKVRVAIAGFGAFMASQQLVTDYLKAIPQAISAIIGAFKGAP